ncbi:hypothetical protein Nepgr_018839 [Nepenthes gracilis]|uniref:Uncharacterized protein n=1 Tax=Nepenthes gracilis TaxID=150966 RepID=A0AAD3SS28_NEPGR|nr:hypothetical protein Nepgr_018839 [Nepenthes gracilis]
MVAKSDKVSPLVMYSAMDGVKQEAKQKTTKSGSLEFPPDPSSASGADKLKMKPTEFASKFPYPIPSLAASCSAANGSAYWFDSLMKDVDQDMRLATNLVLMR